LLQDEDGQVAEAHSVSAGLDYPGVGPEHSALKDSGRARYVAVTDTEALRAFHRLAELEGIIPALETAHAIAWVLEHGAGIGQDGGRGTERTGDGRATIVVNLSGRGDKDVASVAAREASSA